MSKQIDVEIKTNPMNVNIKRTPQQSLEIKTTPMSANVSQTPQQNLEIGVERVVGKNHADLDNLDFEHSGHTGFQAAGDYVTNQELNEKRICTDFR